MRHYDAIKTTKCHVEYEEGTAHIRSEIQINSHGAIPKLVRIEIQNTHHVQVSDKSCKHESYIIKMLQQFNFLFTGYANFPPVEWLEILNYLLS